MTPEERAAEITQGWGLIRVEISTRTASESPYVVVENGGQWARSLIAAPPKQELITTFIFTLRWGLHFRSVLRHQISVLLLSNVPVRLQFDATIAQRGRAPTVPVKVRVSVASFPSLFQHFLLWNKNLTAANTGVSKEEGAIAVTLSDNKHSVSCSRAFGWGLGLSLRSTLLRSLLLQLSPQQLLPPLRRQQQEGFGCGLFEFETGGVGSVSPQRVVIAL